MDYDLAWVERAQHLTEDRLSSRAIPPFEQDDQPSLVRNLGLVKMDEPSLQRRQRRRSIAQKRLTLFKLR